MNRNEFVSLMSAINGAYPNEQITRDEKKVKLWWSMLSDMDYREAANNLYRHIRRCRYVPTIAEIRGEDGDKAFNNFRRRHYDMDKLEMALLGMDNRLEDVRKNDIQGIFRE